MSTLSEIEAAVDALPAAQQQELLMFLAARLRKQGGELPAARRFTAVQMQAWIDQDEADFARIRNGESR